MGDGNTVAEQVVTSRSTEVTRWLFALAASSSRSNMTDNDTNRYVLIDEETKVFLSLDRGEKNPPEKYHYP